MFGKEALVQAALAYELTVRTALDDLAAIKHEDGVGKGHRGQTVADDDRGLALAQRGQVMQDALLGAGVHR